MTFKLPAKNLGKVLVAIFTMSACMTAMSIGKTAFADDAPALALADKTTVAVDAVTVEVRFSDPAPREYPYIGWDAPLTYEQAARSWAAQRFTLTGQSVNSLRIAVRQGSITEKMLPVATGIKGWFKKEQGAEYQATLDVEVAIIDPNGAVRASASGKSWAKETVAENATRADKEKAWLNLTRTTFDNLDRDLIPRLRQVAADFFK